MKRFPEFFIVVGLLLFIIGVSFYSQEERPADKDAEITTSVPSPASEKPKMLRLEAHGFIKPPGLSFSEGVESFLFYGTLNNCLEPSCSQDLSTKFDVNHWLVQEYPLKTGEGIFSAIQNNVWLPLVKINGVQITSFVLAGEAPNQWPAAKYNVYERNDGTVVIQNSYGAEPAFQLVIRCNSTKQKGDNNIWLRSSLYYNLPEGKKMTFRGWYGGYLCLSEAFFPLILQNQEAWFQIKTSNNPRMDVFLDTYIPGYDVRLCSKKIPKLPKDKTFYIKGIDYFDGCVKLETKP